jgi:hypothetical protein
MGGKDASQVVGKTVCIGVSGVSAWVCIGMYRYVSVGMYRYVSVSVVSLVGCAGERCLYEVIIKLPSNHQLNLLRC